MVATRRQVQTDPGEEMEDPNLILKKKPVRKAAAKTNTSTAKATAAKGSSTRSKKAETVAEAEEAVLPIQELEKPATRRAGRPAKKAVAEIGEMETVEAPAKPARAAKAVSVRGRKVAQAVEEVAEEVLVEEPKPSKTTKVGPVRGKKAAAIVEEAPALPAPEEPKTTRSTKAGSMRGKKATATVVPEEPKPTRQTRAAAPKAQPLSPKKITQVSKPQTRTTRTVNAKPALKAAVVKPVAKGRGATKKRTISDENADVPDFHEPEPTAEDDEVVMISSTPVKKSSTRSKTSKTKQEETAESEASMSSRPTTPNDSAAQSFNTIENKDIEMQEDNEPISEAELEAEDGASTKSDESEDELCGPKTPMKRSSPGAHARYQSSIQRTIRKYNDEASNDENVRTPAKRFAVLGSQRGTPQTLKPYCKPIAPPSSGIRPMTVSRGSGRAFVFRDLRDGVPAFDEGNEAEVENEDVSFLPDEDIISVDEEVVPEVQVFVESRPTTPVEMEQQEAVTSVVVEEDEEDFVAPALVQEYPDDPDETVIVHEAEDQAIPSVDQGLEFFGAENVGDPAEQTGNDDAMSDDEMSDTGSVIIHADQAPIDIEEDDETDDDVQELDAPAPTLTFNFEKHLANARPSSKDGEQRHVEETPAVELKVDHDAVAGAEMEIESEVGLMDDFSRRQTVNFNEFIDVAALAEPTATLNIDAEALEVAVKEIESSRFHEVDVTSTNDQEAAEEVQNELTMIHTEHSTGNIMDLDLVDLPTHDEQILAEPESEETAQETEIPHYALPTIAFDARRRSLESLRTRSPVKTTSRPSTSDGINMPEFSDAFETAPKSRSRAGSTATIPVKTPLHTPRATRTILAFGTPARVRPVRDAVASTPKATTKERYPALPSKKTYEGHANTVAPPARFGTPSKQSPKRRDTFHKALSGKMRATDIEPVESTPAASPTATPVATPKERYPALRPRTNYEEHAKTVAAPLRFQTRTEKSPKRRETFHKAVSGRVNAVPAEPETPTAAAPTAAETPEPTTNERYPRLRPRGDYEEHAKTVAGPVRFQTPSTTPVKTPVKRPATISKSNKIRKTAITTSTPVASHAPIKTPLKAAAMTPAQVAMTPHPAAPLRGIVALVEVFTLEGASASGPFVALLHRLGAKTTRSWNERITHVIFKDGSPTTLQRVRLNNKDIEAKGAGTAIFCVNSRWVTDCDAAGARMDENGEAYVVDIAEVPRGGKRRRKSMEPAALLNLGGNIVRDRKSSIGRTSSLSRSPLKFESPTKKVDVILPDVSTPDADVAEKENSGESSPATPAWLSAPGQLVQQTMPMKRVRKLELEDKEAKKSRRLTFWNGVA